MALLIASSMSSFATCNDDFNVGISEYNYAAGYFDKGINSYNTAVELSRSSNPVFLTICNHLVDSVTGFSVSTRSYGNCKTAFEGAMNSCTGQDKVQASQNREVCVGNEDIASDNLTTLRTLLKNTCFKGSGRLESVELLDKIL